MPNAAGVLDKGFADQTISAEEPELAIFEWRRITPGDRMAAKRRLTRSGWRDSIKLKPDFEESI
jgi:hypothetical protein